MNNVNDYTNQQFFYGASFHFGFSPAKQVDWSRRLSLVTFTAKLPLHFTILTLKDYFSESALFNFETLLKSENILSRRQTQSRLRQLREILNRIDDRLIDKLEEQTVFEPGIKGIIGSSCTALRHGRKLENLLAGALHEELDEDSWSGSAYHIESYSCLIKLQETKDNLADLLAIKYSVSKQEVLNWMGVIALDKLTELSQIRA